MINKKVFKNGCPWGTAKFRTEKEFTSAIFEIFGTGSKITSEDTEEELPDGLVRYKESSEWEEDWQKDEEEYRRASEMKGSLEEALFKSRVE